MRKLNLFINKIANWKGVSILTIFYVAFFVFIIHPFADKITGSNGEKLKIVDLTFGYSPQQTLDLISKYSHETRESYFIFSLSTDFFYPIIYAFTLSALYTVISKSKSFNFWKKLPFIIMLFDFLENLTIIILIKSFPSLPIFFAHLCELFKLLKWSLLILFILFTVWKLIRLTLKKIIR